MTMDVADLSPLFEDLETNIDDLEAALEPLLKTALSEQAAKLSTLERAKLYTLVTYAIESLLFSYLKLNGVSAKEHPVFTELTRVKQYFEKIKAADNGNQAAPRNVTLDKQAAGRFIKHGLAGNDECDRQRAEQQSQQWAGAKIKFDELGKKRKAEGEDRAVEEGGANAWQAGAEKAAARLSAVDGNTPSQTKKSKKKSKKSK